MSTREYPLVLCCRWSRSSGTSRGTSSCACCSTTAIKHAATHTHAHTQTRSQITLRLPGADVPQPGRAAAQVHCLAPAWPCPAALCLGGRCGGAAGEGDRGRDARARRGISRDVLASRCAGTEAVTLPHCRAGAASVLVRRELRVAACATVCLSCAACLPAAAQRRV